MDSVAAYRQVVRGACFLHQNQGWLSPGWFWDCAVQASPSALMVVRFPVAAGSRDFAHACPRTLSPRADRSL